MEHWAIMLAALACGTASLCAFCGIAGYRDRRMRGSATPLAESLIEPCIFLFRDDALVDATEPARQILAGCGGSRLGDLLRSLGDRIPDLDRLPEMLRETGRAVLAGDAGTGRTRLRLEAVETDDGGLRVTLVRPDDSQAGVVVDAISLDAMEAELALLRSVVDDAPMMIWRRDAEGRIVWANAAYLRALEQERPEETVWPLPALLRPAEASPAGSSAVRAHIGEEATRRWYDCHDQDGPSGRTSYALPADATVKAEQSLREFLQTLTKTFADLPIGLAIFDRDRQLQLFNPALIDLTGLSAGFLISRPTLFTVLDQLRELRMVPEPKDYRSWRRQIANLESAASAGHHVETWALPGGRTYRVTGRPHPGGAVAFLFDDITSEVTLTRRFRAELSLGAQIIDGLDDAVVVFNTIGDQVFANAAYRQLWPDQAPDLTSALAGWASLCVDEAGLARLRTALGPDQDSAARQGYLEIGGAFVAWQTKRLGGGKVMVSFRPSSAQPLETSGVAAKALAPDPDHPEQGDARLLA